MSTMNRFLSFPIILLFCSLFSCRKNAQNNYPAEPHLEFKNIRIATGFFDILGNPGDSVILYLDFTDGDADIGRYMNDDTIINNGVITFYKKKNGVFNLADTNNYFKNPEYFRIPPFPEPNWIYKYREVTVKTRSVFDGELQLNLFFSRYYSPFNIGDTIKITVQIIDNKFNASNIAEMIKVYSY
jgi:hypothetical protein